MADDHTQRPYRSNETSPARPAPAKGSGNDPLAELARLIGQNDPFAEFARETERRPAAPTQPAQPAQAPAIGWPEQPAAELHASVAPAPGYGRQPFGGAPLSNGSDLYHTDQDEPAYPATRPGYLNDPYDADRHAAGQQEFYDDAPPSRRRIGVLAIAGIFALAVIGTAGAFGYRALFGSSSAAVPPPVIKADSTPSKIVPAVNKDAPSGKQITDRVNDRGSGEKLVSREEQPVDIKDRPSAAFPPSQDAAPSSGAPAIGSGVVGSEPKRVRTIAIHPDQQASASADSTPVSSPTPPMPAPSRAAAPAKPMPPARATATSQPAADSDSDQTATPRAATTRVAPPGQQNAAAAPAGNAPLSLSPDAPARPAPAARAATRSAAVPPAQAAAAGNGNGGGYAVQVSSQRSEAEAQAAFRSLQGKYPDQLGGKQPLIHKADLGAKGIYYRAMVGPFASGSEASELCTALKAAGGQCIVQRN